MGLRRGWGQLVGPRGGWGTRELVERDISAWQDVQKNYELLLRFRRAFAKGGTRDGRDQVGGLVSGRMCGLTSRGQWVPQSDAGRT